MERGRVGMRFQGTGYVYVSRQGHAAKVKYCVSQSEMIDFSFLLTGRGRAMVGKGVIGGASVGTVGACGARSVERGRVGMRFQGTGSVYLSRQRHAAKVKYCDSPTEILDFCFY